jgi:uncharacterized paraquat-inducible protein A
MPITTTIACPSCQAPLRHRPAGRCPQCGADVRQHVRDVRDRERRVEQVVAVVSTLMVVGVSLFVGGCSIVEGVLAYAVAGTVIWVLAKKTFYEA